MGSEFEGSAESGGYEATDSGSQVAEAPGEGFQEGFQGTTAITEAEPSDATASDFDEVAAHVPAEVTPEPAQETQEDPAAFNEVVTEKTAEVIPEPTQETQEDPVAFNEVVTEKTAEVTPEPTQETQEDPAAFNEVVTEKTAEVTPEPAQETQEDPAAFNEAAKEPDHGVKGSSGPVKEADWKDTHVEDMHRDLVGWGIPEDSPELAAILRNEQEGVNAIRAEEAVQETSDLNIKVDKETAQQLAKGEVTDTMFDTTGIRYTELKEDSKLEELSREEYNKLEAVDPKAASMLLTEYNDRHIAADDLNELPRQLSLDNRSGLEVVDTQLSEEKATVKDTRTGETHTVYPNPMGRISHMDGQQGQNSLGMQQDCGIASAAKGTNDVYGKRVTSEERMANFAHRTGNCEIERKPDGSVDMPNSGGTWEGNVEAFYKANGLETEKFVGSQVPEPEVLAQQLKEGGVVSLAVSSDILWNWEKAQTFDLKTDLDAARYQTDQDYRDHVHNLVRMQRGGTLKADHFVNVSNVVCDEQGKATHFIVSDTGNGTTKMVSTEDLHRAYNGDGKVCVSAQGCVFARRK